LLGPPNGRDKSLPPGQETADEDAWAADVNTRRILPWDGLKLIVWLTIFDYPVVKGLPLARTPLSP
jgi:hypothetical protein